MRIKTELCSIDLDKEKFRERIDSAKRSDKWIEDFPECESFFYEELPGGELELFADEAGLFNISTDDSCTDEEVPILPSIELTHTQDGITYAFWIEYDELVFMASYINKVISMNEKRNDRFRLSQTRE